MFVLQLLAPGWGTLTWKQSYLGTIVLLNNYRRETGIEGTILTVCKWVSTLMEDIDTPENETTNIDVMMVMMMQQHQTHLTYCQCNQVKDSCLLTE